ncbi:hypothetical protein I3J27_21415 [Bradyrhizobium xenonodulans]|uniref:Bacteriophage tail tape measure N-terminal domain-containing protein n=1 Tax=Bradyrhizobium xenonodulans TaxID=2736875 RepID=A0ABY7MDD9_9BRAD|nr:hypothetical protein [Bradyrhizobium xenonodulans]WBL75594.1 hypothetical protein I3J27_21415 [Bradyrhizobium xenonodulans]
MSVIGQLKVILGGDTSGLDKSLAESQSKLAAFGGKLALGFAAAAAAATAAAVAVTSQVHSAIEAADQLNKMSQSTGLSTEELSKLKYAADLSDVSTEALGKSMGKLSKAMASAASEGAGPAASAFSAMGVSVKNNDGTLRNSSDVLKDVADKFAFYKDGAEKTNLAIQIFGKSGAALIPLLNQGRDGLQQAGDEAEKFGLVLDKKTTMAAEAFNDNLKRMDSIKQGIVMTVTAKMLPSFEQLSEVMLETRKNTELWNSVGDALANTMKALVTVGVTLVTTWQQIFATASNLKEAFGLLASGEVTAAFDKMKSGAAQTVDAFSGLKQTVSTLWSDIPTFSWESQALGLKQLNREVMEYGKTWALTAAPIVSAANSGGEAIQKFLNTQAKATAAHAAEADSIGKTIGEQEKLKIAYQAAAIAKTNDFTITSALALKISEAGDAAALAAMKVAGAQATVQAMNPAQQFEFQMTQLTQLYNAGVISLETYGERQKQIAEAAQATWGQAGASIAGSFATISAAFGKESAGMAKAAQVFGAIQATISMFTGAAKALELPFPANLAAMAAVLAKGATLVAQIKSQQVPTGFKTGGSFTVGGSGGLDSQFVPIMASPGEQVDIWRPDETSGGDRRRGGGAPTIVNLAMGSVTTRDAFREMIAGLNEMFADGYTLNVKPA